MIQNIYVYDSRICKSDFSVLLCRRKIRTNERTKEKKNKTKKFEDTHNLQKIIRSGNNISIHRFHILKYIYLINANITRNI